MAELNEPPERSDGQVVSRFAPSKIVSGGQTGVDRAGLDAAIELEIEHGGWCPRGRLAEDGQIPAIYQLDEMDVAGYPPRTRRNVKDSDATLILFETKIGDGTRLTKRACQQNRRPCLMMDMQDASVETIQAWLNRYRPETLNIAGTRESISPGIQLRASKLLIDVLRRESNS